MIVKDLEFVIGYSQICKCIISYNDPCKEYRDIWGPFGSIYHWIAKYEVVNISTDSFEKSKCLHLYLREIL